MISGTVKFGGGGVTRNTGNADGGIGFLEHRGTAFDRIIDDNTSKLNALMEAMNGGSKDPVDPENPDAPVDGGDGVEGNDQYIMAKWSQVNGQLNLAISLQGKDTQSAYESSSGIIQKMAG